MIVCGDFATKERNNACTGVNCMFDIDIIYASEFYFQAFHSYCDESAGDGPISVSAYHKPTRCASKHHVPSVEKTGNMLFCVKRCLVDEFHIPFALFADG